MKKNLWILVTVIILLIIAIFFYLTNSTSTIKKELRDFAVEDTGAITKIFLADKQNKTILLERKQGYWLVNNKFEARTDAINLLLTTIYRINIKSPVSKASIKTVIKNLSSVATKVEIYSGNELIKCYYVGGPTQDYHGTYMLLENSSVPFIMSMPGFAGYLTTRYFTEEKEWREPIIFKYNIEDIHSVTVEFVEKPELSFKIINKGNNDFRLFALKNNEEIKSFDTEMIKFYLSGYKRIVYQNYATPKMMQKLDSILAQQPYYIFTVEDKNKQINKVKLFRMRNTTEVDDEGKLLPYDIQFAYAYSENIKELVVVQYYIFDKIMKTLEDFKEVRKVN